ncbi:MAG: hypothetical protein ABIP48_00425 [Planctomycetota bacterium]
MCCLLGVSGLFLCSLGPAGAQEAGWQTELALPGPAESFLAFQPGSVSEERRPPAPRPSESPEPAAPRVTPGPADRFEPSTLLASRSPIVRLAGMPNMYGDFFGIGGRVKACISGYGQGDTPISRCVTMDIPPAGGSGRMKIAENNKALPMDRVYFIYNHYAGALEAAASPTRVFPVDRYIVGAEKTFLDGRWSAEVRMPFASGLRFTVADFDVGNQDVGNLAVSLKRVLFQSDTSVVAAGLVIDTPTGSDVTGRISSRRFALSNDALHLLPYVGFLRAPDDVLFYQGFLQVDIAANGNRVELAGADLGRLTDQNLLFLDLSLGRWLLRNPLGEEAPRLKGLAGIVEVHYTTTLQDTDVVNGAAGQALLQLSNPLNRIDVVNLTAGLHAEIGMTEVRVAGVFPLRDAHDRLFDSELQVSVNRRF